jgi:hypothetical protein
MVPLTKGNIEKMLRKTGFSYKYGISRRKFKCAFVIFFFLNKGQKKEKAKRKKKIYFLKKIKMGLDFEEKKLVQI